MFYRRIIFLGFSRRINTIPSTVESDLNNILPLTFNQLKKGL